MLDIVRAETGSPKGWITLKGGSLAEEVMHYLVQAAMGYWSPLELATTWLCLEIISVCCWDAPLEVVTLSLP